MAKLTRKLWVGIGAATLAGASVAGGAMAQDVHKGHKDGPASAAEAKSPAENPAEGGEAYLIEGGRFVKPVEYQDSRGFVWEAERMIEAAAPELTRVDAAALERIRSALAKLKAAWPAPMPPDTPILQPGEMSALVSDIELHAS